jgi:hypothetical protein
MSIVLMHMNRLKTVIIRETVRGARSVPEGKRGGGCQYTKHVKQGEHARRS